ncbi:hypothetical protein BHM03_00038766 [Ensete ventricosum]|nr:hypothetical protein BHM03_00038766 [Ensete ventricosum]
MFYIVVATVSDGVEDKAFRIPGSFNNVTFVQPFYKPSAVNRIVGRSTSTAQLVRMSGDSGVGSGVLMLEWRSPVGEEIVLLGPAAGSCKEVGSGKSFYSGCCGLFVPDDLTAFMTHHAAAPLAMPVVLVVRRAPAGGGCRPYLCQVGRTAPCCRASRHACRTGGEVCAYA